MVSFALVAEGITDQIILEEIIQKVYKNQIDEEIEVNYLQPTRDATDLARQGNFGGWERIFEYCSSVEHLGTALATNDYFVVQIDTDCAEHKNFGVELTEEGRNKKVEDLVEDVKALIIGKILPQIYEAHREKFIFAIAVHSIECWLIPFYSLNKKDGAKSSSCERHLRHLLKLKDIKYKKEPDIYNDLAKKIRLCKDIDKYKGCNESLDIFVESLRLISDVVE
ncbi:MAG: hypothetical protein K2Y10_13185 [Burkholderiaceae bacterium]|nr:hypothetical protein [Burkholderiaceae bacterium]